MHAAYTAPQGVGCECAPAPCGGVAVDKGCIWHRDTANLWHKAEDCDRTRARVNSILPSPRVMAVPRTVQETPRCDSTHEIPPLSFRCEERQGHRRPHCTHTGGAEVRWLTHLTNPAAKEKPMATATNRTLQLTCVDCGHVTTIEVPPEADIHQPGFGRGPWAWAQNQLGWNDTPRGRQCPNCEPWGE